MNTDAKNEESKINPTVTHNGMTYFESHLTLASTHFHPCRYGKRQEVTPQNNRGQILQYNKEDAILAT
jgi:hypothetical protein